MRRTSITESRRWSCIMRTLGCPAAGGRSESERSRPPFFQRFVQQEQTKMARGRATAL
jgi:hypothetical protein